VKKEEFRKSKCKLRGGRERIGRKGMGQDEKTYREAKRTDDKMKKRKEKEK